MCVCAWRGGFTPVSAKQERIAWQKQRRCRLRWWEEVVGLKSSACICAVKMLATKASLNLSAAHILKRVVRQLSTNYTSSSRACLRFKIWMSALCWSCIIIDSELTFENHYHCLLAAVRKCCNPLAKFNSFILHYIYTYIFIHIHIYTHIHTHTHIYTSI